MPYILLKYILPQNIDTADIDTNTTVTVYLLDINSLLLIKSMDFNDVDT